MQKNNKTFIVGIGASAGGLEAITQLIGHLRPETPCAYIILQHLSPTYRSMMVEILGRETPLQVREASQGDQPQAGTIYVVPANNNALFKEGRLHLVTAPPEVVPKPSINQFLISLAAEEGEAAIGVVLSGTGSDGVAGLRAIQAAGGFTLAQKPETAKYDGMPRAAIDAGVADHVLAPDEIAARLLRLLELTPLDLENPPPDLLARLLSQLREKLQFDFSGYKVGMLMRRIRRREMATGSADLAAYLQWAEQNPSELELLARDILISVTAFFRDREAFEVLRRIVQEICARKLRGSEIRVWVAGCASGEEAYSIAVLFADVLGEQLPHYRVQIFATDIDDAALNIARRGIYPAAAMAEIPADQLERHFCPVNNAYEVAKHLRDMIVFAHHNLVSDPPFMRLDLVSCRNVLIYFDAPLQSKVLPTFHFSLASDGYLFLGRSESVAQADHLFIPIDRRERLFRKIGEASPQTPTGMLVKTMRPTPAQRREHRTDLILTGLVKHFDLVGLLCDSDGNIKHSHGKVERYLQFPVGTARFAVADVIAPGLRGELLALLHRCRKSGKSQHGRRRKFDKSWIRLHVESIDDGNSLLVFIIPDKAGSDGKVDESSGVARETREIEDELLATREHLQTLVEEMATANEEMQALNEEAQASNEELQATNEELEAANEELQATNEELLSLNEELNVKTSEFGRLNDEYSHLYDALPFPILVFDRGGHLIRFNVPAQQQFNLRVSALRQPIMSLRLPPALASLEPLLHRVLTYSDREEEIVTQDGRTLRLAVAPGMNKGGEVVTMVVTLVDVTDLTQALEQVAESQTRLSALMENTTIIFAMKNLQGCYLYANRRFLDFFDVDVASYIGKQDFELLPQALAADLWGLDLAALRERRVMISEHGFDRHGEHHYLRSTHQVLCDTDGQPTTFIVEAEDITVTRHAEEQLRITARVFDQTSEAIMVTDANSIIQTVNAAFTTITGYAAAEVIGKSMTILQSDRHSADFYAVMWRALRINGFWQGEIWNRRKKGDVYPEWLTINRIDNVEGEVEHYAAVFSDITHMKEAQRKAEYLSTHDALTGLPNRALFHDHLRHALAQARRNMSRVALLFIDLDNFKTINDTLGHDIGDELLRETARRLHDAVREADTVARLGGDEFTAILTNCSTEAADQVAHRIIDSLATSYPIQNRSLYVTASVGIAFHPEDGSDVSMLIKAADAAMYRAKEQGRNRVEFFKPDLRVRLLKRAVLESALREALLNNRLRLVYQPQFSLSPERRLVGAEALLRWSDPELGEVSPQEFIPIAESSGLIQSVDRMVHGLLFQQIVEWRTLGLVPPPIAFNVSPRSLRESDFARLLLADIAAANIPIEMLQVEITEGALLENSGPAITNIETMTKAGMRITVDDFGTGYSSLSYLKRLPLVELKIDKSFVSGLGSNREDEAIARAVLALAEALELKTVAEGIETDIQVNWLIKKGCDIGQGYFFAHPMEAAIFEDLIIRANEHG